MAWPQRKTAIDRVGQELSLWDKGRSVKPTSAAWGVPVHVKNPSVKQALELVHHILPERTFSEADENQSVAMMHESQLLCRICFVMNRACPLTYRADFALT